MFGFTAVPSGASALHRRSSGSGNGKRAISPYCCPDARRLAQPGREDRGVSDDLDSLAALKRAVQAQMGAGFANDVERFVLTRAALLQNKSKRAGERTNEYESHTTAP
jgi:hypothetical protein